MQPVLPDPTPQPMSSLSLAVEPLIGVNNILKSCGRNVGLYLGSTATDRSVVVAAASTFDVPEQVQAFVAIVDGPVAITVNNKTINVKSLLVCDEPITSGGISIHNAGSTAVQLHLVYINPSS